MGVFMIHQAKARLSELIDRALRGEEVIIARRRTPLIRLVPFSEGPSTRSIGTAKGRIRIHDDFDTLPTEFNEYTP